MKKIVSLLLITLLITACAKSDDHSIENKTENLSYNFDINGCKTGKQEFSSTADLCQGLQNSKLNNYCALDYRKQYFSTHCPGQTFTLVEDVADVGGGI